jgi:stage II sporulation protein M
MIGVLFNAKRAERHPLEMFFVGFFYASLSIILSLWIFPEHSSLAMVFLSVLACLYIIQGALKIEEKKEKDYNSEKWLLRQHLKPLLLFLFLFLGFVFAFTLWTFLMSPEKASTLFELQESSVEHIKNLTGGATYKGDFLNIISNNLKVLFLSIIFAIFYGAGAIFILAWNASVMGFVIGNLAREGLGIASLPLAFTKYFLHGIPEMFAYLVAALAGGILYVAFIKGDLLDKKISKRLLIDTIYLILISILILVIAAIIEIYISPLV